MPVKIVKSYECDFCGSKINQEYLTRILFDVYDTVLESELCIEPASYMCSACACKLHDVIDSLKYKQHDSGLNLEDINE